MRALLWMLLLPLLLLIPLNACVTSKMANKSDPAQKDAKERKGVLDGSSDVQDQENVASSVFMIPYAPAKPAMVIDAKEDGWDLKKARTFKNRSSLELGKGFWKGPHDASMRVSAYADTGYVYFLVKVQDDVVVEEHDDFGNPVDAVVLWLRDPRLEHVLKSLPRAMNVSAKVTPDIALAISPDGRVRRYDDRRDEKFDDFDDKAVVAAATKTKTGYMVEVALKVEVFPFIASLPVHDVAFRVELLDGDEPKRPGVQSRMSMLPKLGAHVPRFARMQTSGLLPHLAAKSMAARTDGLGYWTRDKHAWSYTNLELLPASWTLSTDTLSLKKALQNAPAFQGLCTSARYDVALLETYVSRNKKDYVSLFVCATRATERTCALDARTRVFWVHSSLKESTPGGFMVRRHLEVFAQPLEQCLHTAHHQNAMHTNFSLLPLEFIHANMWAVGWHKTQEDTDYQMRVNGITVLNSKRKRKAIVAHLYALKDIATLEERTLSSMNIYFAAVDDEKGLDICEVERTLEQSCQGLNQGCKTRPHGSTLWTHTKTWSEDTQAFEPYLLSTHPGCKSSFTFPGSGAFMLIHLKDRISVLAAPK